MLKITRNILIFITCAFFLIIFAQSGFFGSAIDRAATDISIPIVAFISSPFRKLKDSLYLFKEKKKIILENKILKENIKSLERKLNNCKNKEQQYKKLEEIAKLKDDYDYDILPARIILKDNMDWSKVVIINRGRRDGLMENMAVISGAGLVGKIIETGYAYSKVLLLIDRTFRVGARLRNSRFEGLIEGQGMNQLILNYLPREAVYAPGEEVITSGLGGIFPPGYLIGTVKKSHYEEYGFYKYVTVKPAVNFNTLEIVAIVKRLPPQIDVSPK